MKPTLGKPLSINEQTDEPTWSYLCYNYSEQNDVIGFRAIQNTTINIKYEHKYLYIK